MSRKITVIVHEIATDGLPPTHEDGNGALRDDLVGRIAFIWDGYIVSGWPLHANDAGCWEPADDQFGGPVHGVTHWAEFPEPIWDLERMGS